MDIQKFNKKQEIMKDILSKDLEEYHKLVNQKIETFSWKIFAGFLLSKGWENKRGGRKKKIEVVESNAL